MRKNLSFARSAALALALVFSLSAGARAETKAAPTSPTSKAKEVTLKGDLGCAKCSFKKAQECQNVLRVNQKGQGGGEGGGKETLYYLTANAVSQEHHEEVCSGTKPATVTGKVSEEGKGAAKKRVLTASQITIE